MESTTNNHNKKRVKQAFKAVPRKYFLPEDLKNLAELDEALPIAGGQTISQPYTVRLMLEWLQVEPGNKVLDVGSGSGWTTALLSHLTGPKGSVEAVERLLKLVEFGSNNCHKLEIKNARFHKAGKTLGYAAGAPYDRILVSAAASSRPQQLIEQLAEGGRMVAPINYSIYEFKKASNGRVSEYEHPGFVFVPLIN